MKEVKQILVVGDAMLDMFWHGYVSRLSPEAPVPVFALEREVLVPGGAANVCANVAALGGTPQLVCPVGSDEAGGKLRGLLGKRKLGAHMVRTASFRTPVKTRVIGHGQHIVRIDREHASVPASVTRSLTTRFDRLLGQCSVVLVSDYAKGTLSREFAEHIVKTARARRVPVIVDTKPAHIRWFRGATLVAPNLKEATEMTGQHDVRRAGRELRRMTGANVLITQGADGCTLFTSSGVMHFPARVHTVFDVVGAGDTVMASLAVSLSSGLALREAVRRANVAAGLVVEKPGTATVSARELEEALAVS